MFFGWLNGPVYRRRPNGNGNNVGWFVEWYDIPPPTQRKQLINQSVECCNLYYHRRSNDTKELFRWLSGTVYRRQPNLKSYSSPWSVTIYRRRFNGKKKKKLIRWLSGKSSFYRCRSNGYTNTRQSVKGVQNHGEIYSYSGQASGSPQRKIVNARRARAARGAMHRPAAAQVDQSPPVVLQPAPPPCCAGGAHSNTREKKNPT